MANNGSLVIDSPVVISPSETARRMIGACSGFLEELSPGLRRKAHLTFDDRFRTRWHYVPVDMFERPGVSLGEMNDRQKECAYNLLASALSPSGLRTAKAIVDHEVILGELERSSGQANHRRDPGLYFFTVFGDPSPSSPWAWKAEGHHLSLNFTVLSDEGPAVTPLFFGANPAEVRHGPKTGLRILPEEEDLARRLLQLLDGQERKTAIIGPTAPPDILTRAESRIDPGAAEGLSAEFMNGEQRELLMRLVRTYTDRLPDGLAREKLRGLTRGKIVDVHFGWAGDEEPGKPHYYRLHGRSFFVEYDNTQNNANHIHTVWRDPENDFGLDLLRDHYRRGHSEGKGHA